MRGSVPIVRHPLKTSIRPDWSSLIDKSCETMLNVVQSRLDPQISQLNLRRSALEGSDPMLCFGKRIRSTVVTLLLTVTLLTGSLGIAASPVEASDTPWNCTFTGLGNERGVKCYNGRGQYRVAVHCISWMKFNASSYIAYGPWMTVAYARPSTTSCGWTTNAGAAWVQTRP